MTYPHKEPKHKPPSPTLDEMNMRDLATMFCLSGLLSSERYGEDIHVTVNKATTAAECFLTLRRKHG